MWISTVGLINGKHRYLTAETFGFKVNSNGQMLKRRQQWTIEPFPENLGPDGSVSSAASVSSNCVGQQQQQQIQQQPIMSPMQDQPLDPNDPCILTFSQVANNCSLTSMRSSSNGSSSSDQEGCCEEHENIAIKSHLNKYLAVDSFGNVTCDSEEKTENARFTITICSMSQGRSKELIFWAFKNVERGYYLGTTEDGMICCNAKVPKSRAELWHLHLLPARGASFFALKSLGRKRFARVVGDHQSIKSAVQNHSDRNKEPAQVQLDASISWGSETLFQFRYFEGGKYSILSSDYRYLTNEGKCIQWTPTDECDLPPNECLFTLEYHNGFLAFRDSFGQYLAATGRSSILRSRSIGVSRDELFAFDVAPVQVSLKATFNNRWVSIKQGIDLSANQAEISTNHETFQLNYHKQTQYWSIMTQDCNFWTISHNTNTVSVCKPGDYEALNRGQFLLIWSDSDETCSLKYVDIDKNEKWISARKSGQLYLSVNEQAPVKFIMRFQNRRLLNLRPVDGSGFVGLKVGAPISKQLTATKTSADSIVIEYSDFVSGTNGTTLNFESNKTKQNNSPEVPMKPVKNDVEEQTSQTKINLFNVRLNSVKSNQTVMNRLHNSRAHDIIETKANILNDNIEYSNKELDGKCYIDDNNNTDSKEDDENFETSKIETAPNGSVESGSNPSVASIINSFSNARLGNAHNEQTGKQQQQAYQARVSGSVSKLTSTFEAVTQNGSNGNDSASSDVASVITSCSSFSNTSDSSESNIIAATGEQFANSNNANTNNINIKSDQQFIGQLESCYMKILSNNRYLVAGDNNTSIICDATNKACAQPWVLELRSHNSIAIRASDNQAYMQLGTNGTIYLSRCDPKEASLWEF